LTIQSGASAPLYRTLSRHLKGTYDENDRRLCSRFALRGRATASSPAAPALVGKDKQLKLELLELAFGTTSRTAIEEKGPEAIREGYRFIKDEAIARGLAHVVELDGKKVIRVGAAAGEINLPPVADKQPQEPERGVTETAA
jgi:hypothetical protein